MLKLAVDVGRLSCRRRDLHPISFAASALLVRLSPHRLKASASYRGGARRPVGLGPKDRIQHGGKPDGTSGSTYRAVDEALPSRLTLHKACRYHPSSGHLAVIRQ